MLTVKSISVFVLPHYLTQKVVCMNGMYII